MAKANVYDMITDRIIAELEKGQIPWEKPWTGVRDGAYNRITKRPYSLLNQMLLQQTGAVASFGSENYSKEELVAEIGSATLMSIAGIETPKTFRNSTAYIQNWLQVLRSDNKFIVSASSKAEKAVNYILTQV